MWPKVDTTPLATRISNSTLYMGTTSVVRRRYTSNNMMKMRMTVTIVMLFRLESAIDRVSEASGAAPLT